MPLSFFPLIRLFSAFPLCALCVLCGEPPAPDPPAYPRTRTRAETGAWSESEASRSMNDSTTWTLGVANR